MDHRIAKFGLLFAVCIVGIGLIVGTLLPTTNIKTPKSYHQAQQVVLHLKPVVDQVDAEFEAKWMEKGLQVASQADDLTVARRLALALAGTIPSVEEIRALEELPSEQRMDWWISRLLEDERTADHMAERLARGLVGVELGPFLIFRRRRFVKWMSDAIKENRPYDEIVKELLTDEGIWTGSPAVNFVTVTTDLAETEQPDPIRLAARTTRAFLGMRMDCVECHDDFLGTIDVGNDDAPRGGVQTDFHKLAAFFGQVENSIAGIRNDESAGPYMFRLLDDEEESQIDPGVPYRSDLLPSDGPLRQRLASWVTHKDNKQFARAMVNRTWAIMFGKALVNPVDDIPLHGPYPPGLETLADEFIASNYDIHRLIRTIALTRAFNQESRGDFEITPQHERYHAVYPLIRLRPEQVAGAMIQASSLSTIDQSNHILIQLAKFGQTNDFVNRYGDAGEDEFNEKGETVTQRLLMLNGELLQERIDGPLNSATKIAMLAPNSERLVETLYLAVLTRRPSEQTQKHFTDILDTCDEDERVAKTRDIFWTLINSMEFAWNH